MLLGKMLMLNFLMKEFKNFLTTMDGPFLVQFNLHNNRYFCEQR